MEAGAEEVVHGAHHVGNHGVGRVVDASQLTHLGVVFLKEGLVEVDDGVMPAGAAGRSPA